MSELPKGWARVRLGDIGEIRYGKGLPTSKLSTSGYPVFGANGIIGCYSDYHYDDEQLMISCRGANSGTINVSPRKCFITNNSLVIDLHEELRAHLSFIRASLEASDRSQIITGSAQPQVTIANAAPHEILLAPLAEQSRIAAKLDSLFERTRRAREELSHIPRLIESYKKAILESAFRGELIKATPYQNWRTRRIEEIAKVGTGATPKRANGKYYRNGCIPWVTSGAVNQVRIRSVEQFITEAALAETNCKVFPSGALLIAMYGEGVTRGKVAILDIAAATNQALAAIQLEKTDLVSPDYLFWFLESNYLTIRSLAAGGVQPNLNLGIIKNIPVCFPALDEQKVIVEKIESLMEWIRIVGAEQGTACRLLEQLDPATLAKAFRGELVPQDPNDEPASVLLERIRDARAEQPKNTRKGRGKTANARVAA